MQMLRSEHSFEPKPKPKPNRNLENLKFAYTVENQERERETDEFILTVLIAYKITTVFRFWRKLPKTMKITWDFASNYTTHISVFN